MLDLRNRAIVASVATVAMSLLASPGDAAATELAAARIKWLKLKAEIEAAGFSFDLKQFNRAPIPDAENFAAHPLIAELFEESDGEFLEATTTLGKIDLRTLPDFPKKIYYGARPWRDSESLDLAAIAGDNDLDQKEAAKKILRGLKNWEADLDGLVAAANRPNSRYPIDWSESITPANTGELIIARRQLNLRGLSNVWLGNRSSATNDTLALLRTTRHTSADPSLMGALIASSGNSFAYECIWEGLKQQIWNEPSLYLFESELSKLDIRTIFAKAVVFELGVHEKTSSDLLSGKTSFKELFDPKFYPDTREPTPIEIYQHLTITAERIYQYLLDRSVGTRALHPARLRKLDALVGDSVPDSTPLWHSHRSLGIFRMTGITSLHFQTDLNNARIAIAVERFRLKHGKLPAKLDELVPKFLAELPVDPMTDKPLKYLIRPDGTPAIYSVGWDGDDDGGRPARQTDGRDEGDWAWQWTKPEGTK